MDRDRRSFRGGTRSHKNESGRHASSERAAEKIRETRGGNACCGCEHGADSNDGHGGTNRHCDRGSDGDANGKCDSRCFSLRKDAAFAYGHAETDSFRHTAGGDVSFSESDEHSRLFADSSSGHGASEHLCVAFGQNAPFSNHSVESDPFHNADSEAIRAAGSITPAFRR